MARGNPIVSRLLDEPVILIETPQNAIPDEFGLDDQKTNQATSKVCTSDSNIKKISKNLYSLEPSEDGRNVLFMLDKDNTIQYYVSWTIETLSLLPKPSLTQIAVWKYRLPGSTALEMFWKYLFPKTNLAVSDKIQTEKGKRFWVRAIDEAVAGGMFAYLLDFKTNKVIYLDKGNDSFNILSPRAYGDYPEFRQYRWCISKSKLPGSVSASSLKRKKVGF